MKVMTCLEKRGISSESFNQEIGKKSRSVFGTENAEVSFIGLEDEWNEKFVSVEKDLFTIGFFSAPKYCDAKKAPKQEKIVKITLSAETGIETRAEILTHARYGLPTTSDLTKYLAFLKIIFERYKVGGIINNPIQFTHYELLQKAKLVKNKERYKEITLWLERLDNTQIILRGETNDQCVEEKRLYKLFKEVHLSGRTNQDGERIKFNSVWLSDWAINNICEKPLLLVDFAAYQKLKNDVAKLLVVHLQVWLYASRRQGCFEKSYPKFCELIDLTKKKSKSEIIRQLAPALNELKKYEYISSWELVQGSSPSNELKIKIRHGAKFERDLKKGLLLTKGADEELKFKSKADDKANLRKESISQEKVQILQRLVDLGIYNDLAKSLIGKFRVEELERRIAWAVRELHLKQRQEKVNKPGGLLYKIISSEDEPNLLNSGSYDNLYLEIDHQSCDAEDATDESLADQEFEKSKWLIKQFENFCHGEALKNPQKISLKDFTKEFRIGESVFAEFLRELQKRLNEQIYQSWFATLRFAGLSGNVLYVAGGEINRDWVITYYEQIVKQVFCKMNLPDFRMDWIISDLVLPGADIEYFYFRCLVKNYQDEKGITVEEFYQSRQRELDDNFGEFFRSGSVKFDQLNFSDKLS